jgi:hypothetical protein
MATDLVIASLERAGGHAAVIGVVVVVVAVGAVLYGVVRLAARNRAARDRRPDA